MGMVFGREKTPPEAGARRTVLFLPLRSDSDTRLIHGFPVRVEARAGYIASGPMTLALVLVWLDRQLLAETWLNYYDPPSVEILASLIQQETIILTFVAPTLLRAIAVPNRLASAFSGILDACSQLLPWSVGDFALARDAFQQQYRLTELWNKLGGSDVSGE
jgi:hypothetical protein